MMQLYGLVPYGDPASTGTSGMPTASGRTWFQAFRALRCTVESSSMSLIRESPEGKISDLFVGGTDFKTDPIPGSMEGEASMVFAGYGIEAPSKGYDDYKGIDVKNKVVVILDGYPGRSDTTSPAAGKLGRWFGNDFASWKKKMKTALRHGAIAVVMIDPALLDNPLRTPVPDEDDYGDPRHYLPGDTSYITIPCFIPEINTICKIVEGTGIDVIQFEKKAAQQVTPASAPIPGKKLGFTVRIRTETLVARNVIGMIRGVDSTRNIIIGGHYDHLGIKQGEIYNGADDNASGVAGTLAIAGKWANLSAKPACNLIFAAWTGEERGKLGSTWFATHTPIVPRHVSLVVNMDMISRSETEDTARTGLSIGTMTSGRDLRELAKKVNSTLARPFVLDLWDVTNASGSDYRPFADRNIPIITFHAGFHPEYHTQLDDFSRIDTDKMARVLSLVNGMLKVVAK